MLIHRFYTLTTQLLFVWEPQTDTKRRIHKACESLRLRYALQLLHIGLIKVDQLTVRVDARGCYGFRQDRGTTGDCPKKLVGPKKALEGNGSGR